MKKYRGFLKIIVGIVMFWSCIGSNAYAANQSWESAQLIQNGNEITTTIPDSATVRWFKVVTTEADVAIQLQITTNQKERISCTFYEESQMNQEKPQKLESDVVIENKVVTVKTQQPGTYYVRIKMYDVNKQLTQPVIIRSTIKKPDIYENNDIWEKAKELEVNKDMYIALDGENDIDWFKVRTTKPNQQIKLSLCNKEDLFERVSCSFYTEDTLKTTDPKAFQLEVVVRSREVVAELKDAGVYYIRLKMYDTDKYLTQPMIVRSNQGINSNTKPSTEVTEEIVDVEMLPYDKLQNVSSKKDAEKIVEEVLAGVPSANKGDSNTSENISLYIEEAIAQAASKELKGNEVMVDLNMLEGLPTQANETKNRLQQMIREKGISSYREIDRDVKLKLDATDTVTMVVDKGIATAPIDHLRIETPEIEVSINIHNLKEEELGEEGFKINIEKHNIPIPMGTIGIGKSKQLSTQQTQYQVSFNKAKLSGNVTIALPKDQGDTVYQAVFKNDEVIGGKYNPATDKVEVKTKEGGRYKVKENRKNFSDIQHKNKEMQEAIQVLASKGIINGKTATTFAPDDKISRAEIASMLVKTVYEYDHYANGGFKDIKPTDWYYGAAGSAKNQGIIGGYEDNTFRGNNTIIKEQLLSIAARVMRKEKRYKNPVQVDQYLNYTDKDKISNWATKDISLVTRENLITKVIDNSLKPQETMTRGDVAIILRKLFDRIG
ncbi:MAG: S-layer homology domain-containing protein [Cellulosilyticaceae bacterium]